MDDVPAFQQTGAIDGLEFEGWDSRHISIPSSLSSFEEEMSELYEAAFHPSNTTTPRPHPLAQPWLLLPPELEQRRQQQLAVLQAQHQFQVRHHQQQQQLQEQQYYLKHQQQQQLQKQQQQRKTGGTRRKRKMDELRTVYRVPAEKVLTLDKWAWRKYGQKPIKGSPFPRNYYKCSSSKGCIARKQVERSITEPEVYVVTYTGDHFHPWPLHRNALAGITRSSSQPHKKMEAAPPPSNNLEEEEEEDGLLLIPNHKYMDEDLLRGMAELGQWNAAATSSTLSPHTSTPTGFHQQQM